MKETQGRPLPLGTTMIGNIVNFSVAVPQENHRSLNTITGLGEKL